MNGEQNDFDRDFDTFLDRVDCFNVMKIKYEDRCNFVSKVPSCESTVNYVNYVSFMECTLKTGNRFAEWVAIVILIIMILYLGLVIAIVADAFFAPALKVIARLLRMSDHLAGVTLLAFGNSSADLLSNIANIGKEDPMFANCMSNSIFITMVAGGLVCYLRPFEMKGYETIRDVLFFLAGLLFLDYFVQDGVVSRVESACCIGFYLLYIVVNVVDIYLENRDFKKREKKLRKMSDAERIEKSEALQAQRQKLVLDFVQRPSTSRSSKQTVRSSQFSFTTQVSRAPEYVDTDATKYVLYDRANPKNYNLFDDFLNSIKPFTRVIWKESSICMKFFLVLKAPICLITQICIPIVDVEADKHGWSKLLNCIQILIYIPMGFIVTKHQEHIDYMLYSFIISTPLAIFVFIHSRTDLPPFYHIAFALLACSGSLFFIHAFAIEIDIILTLVGNIIGLSEDFCGATVSAWGSAINDLIANVILALQGYESMAFAACFGGPFFTLLISAGIVFSYESWESPIGEADVDNGNFSENAFVFLMMALISTLFWSVTLNFRARRSLGFFNLFLYCLYVVFAILAEKEVIHTYNADPPIKLM